MRAILEIVVAHQFTDGAHLQVVAVGGFVVVDGAVVVDVPTDRVAEVVVLDDEVDALDVGLVHVVVVDQAVVVEVVAFQQEVARQVVVAAVVQSAADDVDADRAERELVVAQGDVLRPRDVQAAGMRVVGMRLVVHADVARGVVVAGVGRRHRRSEVQSFDRNVPDAAVARDRHDAAIDRRVILRRRADLALQRAAVAHACIQAGNLRARAVAIADAAHLDVAGDDEDAFVVGRRLRMDADHRVPRQGFPRHLRQVGERRGRADVDHVGGEVGVVGMGRVAVRRRARFAQVREVLAGEAGVLGDRLRAARSDARKPVGGRLRRAFVRDDLRRDGVIGPAAAGGEESKRGDAQCCLQPVHNSPLLMD